MNCANLTLNAHRLMLTILGAGGAFFVYMHRSFVDEIKTNAERNVKEIVTRPKRIRNRHEIEDGTNNTERKRIRTENWEEDRKNRLEHARAWTKTGRDNFELKIVLWKSFTMNDFIVCICETNKIIKQCRLLLKYSSSCHIYLWYFHQILCSRLTKNETKKVPSISIERHWRKIIATILSKPKTKKLTLVNKEWRSNEIDRKKCTLSVRCDWRHLDK